MGDLLNLSANLLAALLLILSVLILAAMLLLYGRKDSRPRIRQISAFQELQREIGRAAESGNPFHITLGSGGLNSRDAATSLAALQVVKALVDVAISYDIPPIITVGDPTLLPLTQDILRRGYERHQLMEIYDPGQVRFVAPSSIAYAAGAANVVAAEDVIANVAAGAFGSEVSLIADAGARRALPQLAATTTPRAIGALYPATDNLAVGEELYAAGAQMTKRPHYLASLVAQDILRVVLILAIFGAAALAFVGL